MEGSYNVIPIQKYVKLIIFKSELREFFEC